MNHDTVTPRAASRKKAEFSMESYQEALLANQDLQIDIERRLTEIARLKQANRQKAAKLSQKLLTLGPRRLLGGVVSTNPTCQTWERNFFVHGNSAPCDNEDTVKRKAAEAAFEQKFNDDWSRAELKLLGSICKEQGSSVDGALDFEAIRVNFNDACQRKKKTTNNQPRTTTQCKNAYYSHLQPKFTKQEKVELTKLVSTEATTEGSIVDWEKVASLMSTNRSAWECIREYKSKIAADNPQPWTQQQDELLFKYAAAMGPRFMVESSEMEVLMAGVFNGKQKLQLSNRLNSSLLNPNFVRDSWTEDEERRLAICMKIYHDQPNALYRAGLHIQGRSRTSIFDKWNRSLNPQFSARPFTKEEDAQLTKVLRENPHMGWLEVARTFFPDRHPHRIMNRWSEVATDEDIVIRSKHQSLSKSKTGKGKSAVQGDANDSTVEASEVVVQAKAKKRQKRS